MKSGIERCVEFLPCKLISQQGILERETSIVVADALNMYSFTNKDDSLSTLLKACSYGRFTRNKCCYRYRIMGAGICFGRFGVVASKLRT
jgi:hypothetical protein